MDCIEVHTPETTSLCKLYNVLIVVCAQFAYHPLVVHDVEGYTYRINVHGQCIEIC